MLDCTFSGDERYPSEDSMVSKVDFAQAYYRTICRQIDALSVHVECLNEDV